MPKISVIVPVCNAEQYIEKCCENLLHQTFCDYEVIFVNDGSTDSSCLILDELSEKYSNIHVLSQKNQGQATARNNGLKHASGEFVCFVDVDDEVSREMLELLNEAQIKNNADLVWCNAYIMKDNEIVGILDEEYPFSENHRKNYFLHNASPWRKMIRLSILTENSLYFPKLRFYEDLAVVPAYALYTEKIAYVDKPLYYYVLHQGSTMHQKEYSVKFENVFEAIKMLNGFVNRSKHQNEMKDELEYLYIDHLLHAASLRFFEFKKEEKLDKIVQIMKEEYPLWNKNRYFKAKDWKYRLICRLFFMKRRKLLHYILK